MALSVIAIVLLAVARFTGPHSDKWVRLMVLDPHIDDWVEGRPPRHGHGHHGPHDGENEVQEHE